MKFDFISDESKKNLKLTAQALQDVNLQIANTIDNAQSLNEEIREERQANINSEKHLNELSNTVTSLKQELTAERLLREKADEENKKEMNEEKTRNLIFNIITSIVGGLGFILALIQLIVSFVS